jgi:hypothetical protein
LGSAEKDDAHAARFYVVVVGAFCGGFCGVAGTGDTGLRPTFFPSAAVLGSGAAPGMPFADGVWLDVVAGCVIAGGLFW